MSLASPLEQALLNPYGKCLLRTSFVVACCVFRRMNSINKTTKTIHFGSHKMLPKMFHEILDIPDVTSEISLRTPSIMVFRRCLLSHPVHHRPETLIRPHIVTKMMRHPNVIILSLSNDNAIHCLFVSLSFPLWFQR